MTKQEIEALLRKNPKAEPHAESIHETLKAIRELRKAGVSSAGYDLTSPYKGLGGFDRLPRLGRSARGSTLKRTVDA